MCKLCGLVNYLSTQCLSVKQVQWQILTDVSLMIDDGVEGHILVLKVPLRWLNIVCSLVGINEALKAPINHGAMGQCALFT